MKVKAMVSILMLMFFGSFTTGFVAEASPVKPKPEKFKLVIHDPSTILTFKQGLVFFRDEVPKRTGGRVHVELLLGGVLGGFAEQPDNIQRRVFDMGMLPIGYHPAKTPLWQVGEMPGITNSIYAHNRALVELARHPSMRNELEKRWNQKLLFPGSMDTFEMITRHPITSIDDLKGYPIRAIALASRVLSRLGARVSAIRGPDVFSALERGVVSGAVFPVDTMVDRKLHTVANNLILSGKLGFYFGLVTINLDTWNSLPHDIQQIILEVSREATERNIKIYLEANLAAMKAYQKAGTNIITLSAAERARIQKVNHEIWEEWIAAREKDGFTEAREIFDLFVKLVRKFEKEDPYAAAWWPKRM